MHAHFICLTSFSVVQIKKRSKIKQQVKNKLKSMWNKSAVVSCEVSVFAFVCKDLENPHSLWPVRYPVNPECQMAKFGTQE
jgi:hypothetical protein